MSAAAKSLLTRTKRAKLIAAMGLVSRDEKGFNVKSPSRSKESYRVWRDERGRIRCTCVEYETQLIEDPRFRCEHILAVKYHLEPPSETSATEQETHEEGAVEIDLDAETESLQRGECAAADVKASSLFDAEGGLSKTSGVEDGLEKASRIDDSAGSAGVGSEFTGLLKLLSAPIPRELVRKRVGWTDNSGVEHEIDYIEWHTVADMLDHIYPEWSHSVKNIRHIGDLVAVTASITIMGVTREGVGTGAAIDEKGIKKAEHDALKRAAVKFGIARELYKKDEDETAPIAQNSFLRFPRDPVARNTAEIATSKQLAAIRAIANAQGANPEAECLELLNCSLDELSRRAASAFIDYLKSKQMPLAEVG